MPNLNKLILTAADYKVAMTIPGVSTFMLQTANAISWSEQAENELIYRVGDEEPIGNKNNANKYSGKFSLQVGELETILKAAQVSSGIKIANAVLSITATAGAFSKTWSGMCFTGSASDVKAKDKESIVNLDWTAQSMV